jgi:predicted permease
MSLARRAASRAYALALRAFPPRHRAEYAREMIDAFEQELAARRRERGVGPALGFGVAACLNAAGEGLGERRGAARPPSGRLVFGAFGRDLAHAVRSLAKARGFTLVSVLSLGVGMGAVMAIMLFLRAVTGTPPGVNANGLVELLVIPSGPLRAQAGDWAIDRWSYPDFETVRDADTGLSLTGWAPAEVVLRLPDGRSTNRVQVMYASPNYFTTIGARLLHGPGFNAAASSDRAAQPVVVIGYYLWRDRLGADPGIVGRTVTLNRVPHLVVGIGPEKFDGHMSPEENPDSDAWLPLDRHPRLQASAEDNLRFSRDIDWVRVMGRLEPGATLERANSAVTAVMTGLAAQYPESNQYKAASVEPYMSMGARLRPAVTRVRAMLLGVSGAVLLIVCLNISGMVLVRSASRERELAVRLAIGASRGRLVQYLLSEAFVLALLGGALASAVLFGLPPLLLWWFEIQPGADFELFRPDGWMAAYGFSLCVVTSLVFGLLPAIRFSRPGLVTALKDDSGGGRRRVGRVHRLTAAAQAGLAIPFLALGVVKLDEVRTTATADLGFEKDGFYAVPLDLSSMDVTAEEGAFLVRSAREYVSQAAGVQSVSVANGLPLDFDRRIVRISRVGNAGLVRAHSTRVADRYFETMRIPILRGRGVTEDDREGAPLVVVLSEPLAVRLFPGDDALGKPISFALDGNTQRAFTVVGVSADVVATQMADLRPQLFVPLAQHRASQLFVIARASADVGSMTLAFQNSMTALDPELIRGRLVTGERLVGRSMTDLTTHSVASGMAAAVALTLAALGIYGVVGYMVATRTREIGVRMALGASRRRMLSTVLAEAVKLILPGVVVGLVGAVWFVRSANPSWYPLGGVEPLSYAAAVAVALAVALVAGFPSARRAASVQPIVAMRSE